MDTLNNPVLNIGTKIAKHYSKPDYFLKLSIILIDNCRLAPP